MMMENSVPMEVPMEEEQPLEMVRNTFDLGAHVPVQNLVHCKTPECATSFTSQFRSADRREAQDGYGSSPRRSDNGFCSSPYCSDDGPESFEGCHDSLSQCSDYGYSSSPHGSDDGYGSLPYGPDDGYGTMSHSSARGYGTLSHSSSGHSSANGYGSLPHSSEEGNNSSLHSFADGHGSSHSPHCSQNSHGSLPHPSEMGSGISPYSPDDGNGSPDDGNGSSDAGCGSLSHLEQGFPHCSAEPDEALSVTICALAPCVHEATIRGQLRDQESASKIRSKERSASRKNVCRREKARIGQSFQLAVDAHDWHLAESLIPLADMQRLNDGLCMTLDSVWFLGTREELYGATRLMEKLVEAGADDFTRAALRTSFLASCVSACQSRTLSLADTVTKLEERLHERLQECSGYEMLKAEAAANVQQFAEWALRCINSHSRARQRRGLDGEEYPPAYSSSKESQLQLRAFKRFLELAGNWLTGKDYTEAFDAACFPLTLFSTAIDSGWASGIAAIGLQGLLGMLVEGGADNVNQCCLDAARFGSTDLLRILLQIAQRNGIEVDVDLALEYASHYYKIETMEYLVDNGNASAFLGPLMRAANRGCMPTVKWFVERGCRDNELCWALIAAASSSRVEVADYLIKCVPLHVLRSQSSDILKAAGERSAGCLKGITFLLQSDFLCSPEATYAVADSISKLEDQSISAELKSFCKDEWSSEAFLRGRKAGEDHYLNVLRVIYHGSSPLHLQELPQQLQVAIAYFPLYKECAATCGSLLSQWLRGQLVEAALRLDAGKGHSAKEFMEFDKGELLAVLESRLPSFFVGDS